jgi:glycosyltransferase involved in cell wall biosynthesis
MSPKISVCLICKNEELFIRHCLESVVSVADEIIVLDTGSTDRTKEIVREFSSSSRLTPHVSLFETTWRNDFAWAKNKCLSYATGEWIIFIDANEMLAPETQQAIPRLVNENHDKNEALIIWFRVNNFEPENPTPVDYYLKQFLFKNGFGIHYLGIVHESLVGSDIEIKNLKYPFLQVNHFSIATKPEKIKYYASLSEKIINDPDYYMPDRISHYFHLALCYSRLGDHQKALEIQMEGYNAFKKEKAVLDKPLFITLITELASNLIFNFGKSEEAIAYLQEGLQIHPDFPDALFFLGLAYLGLGRYRDFTEVYTRLSDILTEGKFEEQFMEFSSRGRAILPRVYLELGRVLIISGEKARGEEYLLRAHQLFPGKKEILLFLIYYYAINDQLPEAIDFYLKYRPELSPEEKINLAAAGNLPVGSPQYRKTLSDLLRGLVNLNIWLPEELAEMNRNIGF